MPTKLTDEEAQTVAICDDIVTDPGATPLDPDDARELIAIITRLDAEGGETARIRNATLEEAAAWCDEAAAQWRAATRGEGNAYNRGLRAMQYETTALNMRSLKDEEPAAPESQQVDAHNGEGPNGMAGDEIDYTVELGGDLGKILTRDKLEELASWGDNPTPPAPTAGEASTFTADEVDDMSTASLLDMCESMLSKGSIFSRWHGLVVAQALHNELSTAPTEALRERTAAPVDREWLARWIFSEHHPFTKWDDQPPGNFQTWYDKADKFLASMPKAEPMVTEAAQVEAVANWFSLHIYNSFPPGAATQYAERAAKSFLSAFPLGRRAVTPSVEEIRARTTESTAFRERMETSARAIHAATSRKGE